ncbi:MAG TPA: glutamine synthetase III, partial [Chitinophagaceae bacterium]|nr:glutamine synthetase III [Chitinophagaceae bacterium]
MSLRFSAINANLSKSDINYIGPTKITPLFGENVFTLKVAREYLSDEAYKSLSTSINTGKKLDRSVANQIAIGLRAWSENKGVTHFTHWFQP